MRTEEHGQANTRLSLCVRNAPRKVSLNSVCCQVDGYQMYCDIICSTYNSTLVICGGAFRLGTALQAERSWVRIPMVLLEF
jgi:hypothetical protein